MKIIITSSNKNFIYLDIPSYLSWAPTQQASPSNPGNKLTKDPDE